MTLNSMLHDTSEAKHTVAYTTDRLWITLLLGNYTLIYSAAIDYNAADCTKYSEI